jgi:NAD-dependent SIR2 family protein deacetylase
MIEALEALIRRHPRLVALTGAGVSAASGIPTYRDESGDWKRGEPIQHQAFVSDEASRRRYWARSLAGWQYVADSAPNSAHFALAELERLGHVGLLATQNVDRLHQRAGHRAVVDLHGRIDRIVCLDCGSAMGRNSMQEELESLNPGFCRRADAIRPDGDAELPDRDLTGFLIPACRHCRGVLMPDVVFFGGSVPRARVRRIEDAIVESDALLVAGSSLMVYSGFRFCRLALELGKPLALVNLGTTRADDIATLKINADCGEALIRLARRLARP